MIGLDKRTIWVEC